MRMRPGFYFLVCVSNTNCFDLNDWPTGDDNEHDDFLYFFLNGAS